MAQFLGGPLDGCALLINNFSEGDTYQPPPEAYPSSPVYRLETRGEDAVFTFVGYQQ